MFQHVELLWIINNNKHYRFEIDLDDTRCTDKLPWYNTNISAKLNGQIFEDYYKTVQADRYDFMCYVDTYDK